MFSQINYILGFCAAIGVCGLLTPVMRKFALSLDVVDRPNQDHKTHKEAIPYLGGIAIILSVFSVTLGGALFLGIDNLPIALPFSIILPALVLGVVGLIDDIRQLSPFSRFVAQTISGLFTASFLILTKTVGSPTGIKSLDFLITVVWIVGVTNSINFFDNHDGGASGTVAIASFALFYLAYTSDQNYLAAFSIVLCGSCIGFLYWNRNPARIYMGDAGALFLGTMIASLLVRFDPNPINRVASFSIPIFILAIPILDTSVAVLSRIRRHKSPFEGGKDHLSHRLVRIGYSRKTTAMILWLLSIGYGLLAIAISSVAYAYEGMLVVVGVLAWILLLIFFMHQKDE